MFLIVLAAVGVAPATASASGGGTISLGAVGGSGSARTIDVVTGAATDPWSGYNIHIATALGGGLTLNNITDANGALLAQGPICLDSDPAKGQRIFGCVEIGQTRASIVTAGQLAVFTFNTTGSGCMVVGLVTAPGDRTNDTYTIDRATSLPQTNAVDPTPRTVLVGAGQNSDCPNSPKAIGTPAASDKPTATRQLTSTPPNAATATSPSSGASAPAPVSGGVVSLGAVGGSGDARTIEVVTDAATAPWSGYNIHIATTAGSGVTVNSITGVNGSLLTATPSALCFGSNPSPGQRILGCATVGDGRASIASAGQLALFTFNTTGDGCLVVELVDAPGDQTAGTYTIDRGTSLPQANAVNTSAKTMLVGTGEGGDCPAPARPTNAAANGGDNSSAAGGGDGAAPPDASALSSASPAASPSSDGSNAAYLIGAVIVLVLGAAGAMAWRRRRN
jgi:hypothetical protein